MLAEPRLGIQLPLSLRKWPGTFHPGDVGLGNWDFVKRFGRQMPGGGVGTWQDGVESEKLARTMVSGPLDINCLGCHDAAAGHDQTQYAAQVAQENFRWAGAATSDFASVSGSAADMPDTFDYVMPEPLNDSRLRPPEIAYREGAFDDENRVLFNVVRRPPSARCYFCHSTAPADLSSHPRWLTDEDVHLAAGMLCVDCHRNDIEHEIVRGYPSEAFVNSPVPSFSCESCHLGQRGNGADEGALGAPRPRHVGLPPVHFERMTCTACHSGAALSSQASNVKTSMSHGLGLHGVSTRPTTLPHILSPVFARDDENRIAPHHLVWPSFWAEQLDEEIRPVSLQVVSSVFSEMRELEIGETGWPELSEEDITAVLRLLDDNEAVSGRPAYVTGGQLIQLSEGGVLETTEDHPIAEPYAWCFAHDVRPAAQSLGARDCTECHAVGSNFFFASVPGDSPLASARSSSYMLDFQELDHSYTVALAKAWRWRPVSKALYVLSSCILLIVLVGWSWRAMLAAGRWREEDR